MAVVEASGTVYPKSTFQALKVKLTHPNAVIPTRAHPSDAGLDLYSVSDINIVGGGTGLVETGISVEVPYGFVGLVYIRSSVGFKHNVTLSNSVGVVDSSYRGDLKVALTNHSQSSFFVNTGDRIAQLVLTPILLAHPIVVDDLEATDRGEGGFGSSGK